MSERHIKQQYLSKLEKLFHSLHLFFDTSLVSVDEFTEESMFIELWESEEMCSQQFRNPQLFKLWLSRIKQMNISDNDF